MTVIYLVGTDGVLAGPITLAVVPGIGAQMPDNAVELPAALPAADAGYAWAFVEGAAQQLPDHRGIVYRTEDGSQLFHDELGPLPDGLTEIPKPGPLYVWSGDGWVLDVVAELEAAHAAERAWRNAQIAATDFLVMPDYPISDARRAELYAYRQSLRDWPVAGQFPDGEHRPQPPDWITEYTQ